MVADMDSFASLIDKLGGPVEVAKVLGQTPDGVRKMRQRDRVDPTHWPTLVELAKAKQVRGVTVASLATLAVGRPRKRRAA